MFDIVPIEAIWIVIVSAVIFAVIMYNVVHSPSADKKFNYVVLRGKEHGNVFWTVDIGQYEGYEVLYQGTMEDCKKEWEKHCCGGKFNL